MADTTPTDADLIRQGRLARCGTTGRTFDVGRVEVVQRYADCSVFRCPSCRGTHDDRRSWGGLSNQRMGYSLVLSQPPTGGRWTQ